jgi:hypothetical protein
MRRWLKGIDLRIPIGAALVVLVWFGPRAASRFSHWAFAGWYVKVSLQWDPSGPCSPTYPLRVRTFNGSSRRISRVSFDPVVSRAGHSSNLAEGYSYDSDYFIAPGATVDCCWGLTPLEAGAGASWDYRVKLKYVEFD